MGQGPWRNRTSSGERPRGSGESEVQRSPQGLASRSTGAGMSTRCRPETREGAATPGGGQPLSPKPFD